MMPTDGLRRRRLLRALGLILAFGPLLAAGGLGGLWVRSLRVQETGSETSIRARLGGDATAVVRSYDEWGYEVAHGVMGLLWEHFWDVNWLPTGDPDAAARLLLNSRKFNHRVLPATGPFFGRNFGSADAWSVCRSDWRRSGRPSAVPGFEDQQSRCWLVVPFWMPMIPLTLPSIWWSWCPKGRAWPRLTIRRLVYVTMGAAGLCGVLVAFARASSADRAIIAIEDLNGRCLLDTDQGEPIVTGVALSLTRFGHDLDDQALARLRSAFAALPRLKTLRISSDRVTGAGLALLADQPELDTLSVDGTGVDDDTLSLLRDHRRLRVLDLAGTLVTDRGLAHLRLMPRLEAIYLDHLSITDAGLVHLQGMPRLETISLRSDRLPGRPKPPFRVTEAGVQHLFRTCPKLQRVLVPDGRWEMEDEF